MLWIFPCKAIHSSYKTWRQLSDIVLSGPLFCAGVSWWNYNRWPEFRDGYTDHWRGLLISNSEDSLPLLCAFLSVLTYNMEDDPWCIQDGKFNTVIPESQALANILAIVQRFFFWNSLKMPVVFNSSFPILNIPSCLDYLSRLNSVFISDLKQDLQWNIGAKEKVADFWFQNKSQWIVK